MSDSTQNTTDVWEKLGWLWNVLFYLAILVSSVFMLTDDDLNAPLWVGLLLTTVLILWNWIGLRLTFKGHGDWDKHVRLRFVVIMGDVMLWYVLLAITPAFYFALFGFGLIFYLLPIPYAAIAAFSVTMGLIYEQIADNTETLSLTDPRIWMVGLTGVGAVAMGVWISAIVGQSIRRRDLINQLEQAQAELVASEHRSGILEERQRLAREIHDTLAQGFTSIVMHLEAADQARFR